MPTARQVVRTAALPRARGALSRARGGGRYLRRLTAAPNPELGFGPATRVGAGLMVFPRGAAFGPRKQTGYEVILLHDGELVIEADGLREDDAPHRVHLLPGGVTLLVPGPRCTFRFSAEAETRVSYVITYDPALPLAAGARAPGYRAARDVVRQRLTERIGLKELAAAGHVSPEHLVRLFRRRLATTPVRFLWAARVRLGVHLLENTDLPVADVARRVGCRSPKDFTRLVRADFGLPPREIRRRLWGDGTRPPWPAA